MKILDRMAYHVIMRADYDTLASAWDALTAEYVASRCLEKATTQSVKNLAWLAYKTKEAELIRRHGWTVLEFEQEMDRNCVNRTPVGVR